MVSIGKSKTDPGGDVVVTAGHSFAKTGGAVSIAEGPDFLTFVDLSKQFNRCPTCRMQVTIKGEASEANAVSVYGKFYYGSEHLLLYGCDC